MAATIYSLVNCPHWPHIRAEIFFLAQEASREDKRITHWSPFLNTFCRFIFLPSGTKRFNGPCVFYRLTPHLSGFGAVQTVYTKTKVVIKIMITVIIVASWQSLPIWNVVSEEDKEIAGLLNSVGKKGQKTEGEGEGQLNKQSWTNHSSLCTWIKLACPAKLLPLKWKTTFYRPPLSFKSNYNIFLTHGCLHFWHVVLLTRN